MSVHVCKECGSKFEYCRKCVFKPIVYKDKGFCSKDCYEKSKNKIEEIIPKVDVEVIMTDEDTSTPKENGIEYPQFFAPIKADEIHSKRRKHKIIESIIEENTINENQQDNGETV